MEVDKTENLGASEEDILVLHQRREEHGLVTQQQMDAQYHQWLLSPCSGPGYVQLHNALHGCLKERDHSASTVACAEGPKTCRPTWPPNVRVESNHPTNAE